MAAWPFLMSLLGVLLVFSAFFSGSETALMAVDRWRLRHLARKGGKPLLVQKTLEEPDKLISTILLGNNLVNVAASAIATSLAVSWLGDGGVIWATLVMTVLILIVAELTPKTIAAYYPEKVAILVIRPITVLIVVLYPVVRLLAAVSGKMIGLLGIGKADRRSIPSPDEIAVMIKASAEQGVLRKRDEEMLQAVLALDKIRVESVMVPMRDVVSFDVEMPWQDVFDIARRREFSRYPVYQGQKTEVLGFVHIKDLFKWHIRPDDFSLRKILRQATFVPEGKSARKQLVDFQKSRLHLAFVVDEYGEVVGIVTLEDILEEIVGEIEDEHDRFLRRIQRRSDGSYAVDGSLSIRHLNKWLGWNLPEDGYQTIAGFVLTLFGRLPEKGEEVEWQNFNFRVDQMFAKSITRIVVQKKKESL
ncbi:MAG: DUF21 domain-containing protein [Deltaproteobacteria bacterium]|nr:DUF21 domain-containing protein [Deltaproteobacteria bacterium]MBW2071153.1 DUF21 domain-containing protein [Deltaproteobacteria bacterium]